MAKVKVYELAKELGVESKDVIEFLGKNKIEVTSHSSGIEESEAEMVRRGMGKGACPGKSGGSSEEEKYRACVPPPEYTECRETGQKTGRTYTPGRKTPAGGTCAYAGKTHAGE